MHFNFEDNFQNKVTEWVRECFGRASSYSVDERAHRFLEEALELYQACEMSKQDAITLVEYVFSRRVGELKQEVGGTMVTLAALCSAAHVEMDHLGEVELARCWDNIDKIRIKAASKKTNSALPGAHGNE